MKQTSRISCSRSLHGSRPSTRSSPSKGVSPRIALSAVVLPAPLGPISPRIRPSSTRRSTPSSAAVAPKFLRRPRASMHAIASALLLPIIGVPGPRRFCAGWGGVIGLVRRGCAPVPGALQQLIRRQPQPLNRRRYPGPLFRQKFPALALQQQAASAALHKHSQTSPFFHQLLVHQLLIGLENRERIDPIFRSHRAHGRQRIALLEHAV